MLLSFSIETFLTNYDVMCKKLKQTPLYENEQNEGKISQWRLLIFQEIFTEETQT